MSPVTVPASAAGARTPGAIASSAIAETTNDAASTAKAVPAPSTSMSTPPSAGPARRSAIGRTNWSSALACASSLAGSTSGTSASKDGLKNAVPPP